MNSEASTAPSSRPWTFLSNYGHVLICLSRNPLNRLRDVAQQVGITERAAQRIVSELEQAGILTRIRDGRRNRYELNLDRPLRHPLEAHRSIGDLLAVLGPQPAAKKSGAKKMSGR